MATLSFAPEEKKFLDSLRGLPDPDFPDYASFVQRVMDRYLSMKDLDGSLHPLCTSIKTKVDKYFYDLQYNQQVEDALSKKSRKQSQYSATKSGSYDRIINVTESHATVLDCLKKHGPMSRRAIADHSHMFLSSVCGRVDELLALGLIVRSGKVKDPETNRPVETVALKETK